MRFSLLALLGLFAALSGCDSGTPYAPPAIDPPVVDPPTENSIRVTRDLSVDVEYPGDTGRQILANHFEADRGLVSYSTTSSDLGVVTVSQSGSAFPVLEAKGVGSATIWVTASAPSGDGEQVTATQEVTAVVKPTCPRPAELARDLLPDTGTSAAGKYHYLGVSDPSAGSRIQSEGTGDLTTTQYCTRGTRKIRLSGTVHGFYTIDDRPPTPTTSFIQVELGVTEESVAIQFTSPGWRNRHDFDSVPRLAPTSETTTFDQSLACAELPTPSEVSFVPGAGLDRISVRCNTTYSWGDVSSIRSFDLTRATQ